MQNFASDVSRVVLYLKKQRRARLPISTGLIGSSATTGEIRNQLLQLRVLCLGLFQDGNVRVGILPERKEVMIFRAGLGGVAL